MSTSGCTESRSSFIEIDGVKFYSDTFYLNAPTGLGLPLPSLPPMPLTKNHHPLFDRSKLIQSLKLKAAIVSTYVFDPEWMSKEMPSLFPTVKSNSVNTVPTLLLHGQQSRGKVSTITRSTRNKGNSCDNRNHYDNAKRQNVNSNRKVNRNVNNNVNINKKGTILNNASNSVSMASSSPSFQNQYNEIIEIMDSSSDSDTDFDNDINERNSQNNNENTNMKQIKLLASKHKKKVFCEPQFSTSNNKNIDSNNHSRHHGTSATSKPLFGSTVHVSHVLPQFILPQQPISIEKKMVQTREKVQVQTEINDVLNKSNNIPSITDINHGKSHDTIINDIDNNVIIIDSSSEEEEERNIYSHSLDHYNLHRCKRRKKYDENNPCNSQKYQHKHQHFPNERQKHNHNSIAKKVTPTPSIQNNSNPHNNMNNVKKNNINKKRCMGTHHPKYMILFEQSGSIIVLVSTSNMTKQCAVDGTWLQRFYPKKYYHHFINTDDQDDNVKELDKVNNNEKSDFGDILCDFLQKQSDAIQCNETMMTPITFLKHYLGFNNLREFCNYYAFQKASVYLVSTVPGIYPGRFGSSAFDYTREGSKSRNGGNNVNNYDNTNEMLTSSNRNLKRLNKRRIFYGPQRVSAILNQCTMEPNPCLPIHVLSKSDKFIIQTTSFGSKWNKQRFHELIRQYMGFDGATHNRYCHDVDINKIISNVDIIWPSKQFMNNIKNDIQSRMKHYHDNQSDGINKNNDKKSLDELFDVEHFTFLSSESFNLIDQECLSRMTKYEDVNPSLLPYMLSPHIKSYARVMTKYRKKHCNENRTYANRDTGEEPNLAWFMLTSACLSRGAQGHAEKGEHFENVDEKSYFNFELGVLFCSKLQGNAKTDILYRGCYDPTKSGDISSGGTPPRVIHLPIPYKLLSSSYQKFTDEVDFDEDPFMHDVTTNSAVARNMSLTPYGKKIINRFST